MKHIVRLFLGVCFITVFTFSSIAVNAVYNNENEQEIVDSSTNVASVVYDDTNSVADIVFDLPAMAIEGYHLTSIVKQDGEMIDINKPICTVQENGTYEFKAVYRSLEEVDEDIEKSLSVEVVDIIHQNNTELEPVVRNVDVEPSNAVVPITTFDQLQAAISEAIDGETTTISVNGTISMTAQIVIPANKDIVFAGSGTIELADTLIRINALQAPILVQVGAKLTVDGITIDGKAINRGYSSFNGEASLIKTSGECILNSGTLKNTVNVGASVGVVLAHGSNGSFVMNGGSIEGHSMKGRGSSQYVGIVLVKAGASFVMNDGYIQNNNGEDISSAPVYVEAKGGNSNFLMAGGTIQNNNFEYGGVFVGDSAINDSSSYATFTMTGGTITHNTGVNGGGVSVFGRAEFILEDGNITHNTANGGMGGGICIYDFYYSYGTNYDIETWHSSYSPTKFIMNGGNVSNNRAIGSDGGAGGGIYIGTPKATINAGTITDNTAEGLGGGIYVAYAGYKLQMYDAIITQNTASGSGGGIWACPTGTAEVTVTAGGTIYDNTANLAGDDFTAQLKSSEKYYTYLANRMLGGGQVFWYKDEAGKRYLESTKELVSDVDNNFTSSVSLKSEASAGAKQRANELAKVIITGNTARNGGGIGTNGDVIIGTERTNVVTLDVTKEWDSSVPANIIPESVEVYLMIDGDVLDSIILSEDNNWHGQFLNLPDNETITYAVKEVVEGKFTVHYSEAIREGNTIYITIVNSYEPDTPITPPVPPIPKPPVPPTPKPPKEDNPKPSKSETPKLPIITKNTVETTKVNTGDSLNSGIWMLLLGVSISTTGILLSKKQRIKEE